MKQEFVTLPREVVELAIEALFCTDSEEGSTAYKNELKAVKKLRAALDQPKNHVPGVRNMVLAGWKMVPVEPTEKMIDFGRSLSSFPDGVYRAMLAAAPQPPTTEQSSAVQPQANQPAMTPIAQRKLEDLVASGYTISGYSVYHEQRHQHGFVTGAGLVGWWKPEGMEYPQPQGEQPLRYLDGGSRHKVTHLTNAGYCIHGLPREMLGQWVAFVDATDNKHMANQQPKREPLTDEQIGALARNVPSGYHGFAQQALYDFREFARAIEHHHNIK